MVISVSLIAAAAAAAAGGGAAILLGALAIGVASRRGRAAAAGGGGEGEERIGGNYSQTLPFLPPSRNSFFCYYCLYASLSFSLVLGWYASKLSIRFLSPPPLRPPPPFLRRVHFTLDPL
jgi:hypothetical protein